MAFNIHNRSLLSLEHHTPRELRYLLSLITRGKSRIWIS